MNMYFQRLTARGNKRARTRSLLLDAATAVFAKNGIDDTRIDDITTLAGVASTTFYNHFKDKSELVYELVMAVTVEISRILNQEMINVDDAASRVVVATSRFLRIATDEQLWGRILLDAFYLLPERHVDIGHYVSADIQRGVDQGVFRIPPDRFLIDQVQALIMSTLQTMLRQKRKTAGLINRTNENILRMLGMTPEDAHRVTQQAMSLLDLKVTPTRPAASARSAR